MPRFHCPIALAAGDTVELPSGAARHVQVLRLQPGARITLFNGEGGEFEAVVERMGRSDVAVRVESHNPIEREASREIHLAVVMPANERMDWLVEKATELGAASIQPLVAERSVLRLTGERAQKKLAHWQAIAVAASEQCGRNRVPRLREIAELRAWLARVTPPEAARLLLSLAPAAVRLHDAAPADGDVVFLTGPEGGWSEAEERAAIEAGFRPVTLGARVLRAETASLAALAALGQ